MRLVIAIIAVIAAVALLATGASARCSQSDVYRDAFQDKIKIKNAGSFTGKVTYRHDNGDIEFRMSRAGITKRYRKDEIEWLRPRMRAADAARKDIEDAQGSYVRLVVVMEKCVCSKLLKEAAEAARLAIRADPRGREALQRLPDIYERLDDIPKALDAIARAERVLGRGNAQLGLRKASILLKKGEVLKAMEVLKPLYAKDSSPPVRLLLAKAHLAKSAYDLAQGHYLAVSHADPGNLEARVGLGNVLLAIGKPAGAEPHFDRAVAINDQHVGAWLGLGISRYLQGRYDTARAAFDKALIYSNMRNGLAHLGAALSYWAEGDAELGLKSLNNAITESPSLGRAHIALGYVEDVMGGTERAVEHYTRATEKSPLDAYCHYVLGHARFRLGEMGAAEASFRRALKLSPKSPLARSAFGSVLLRLGRAAEAVTILREAAESASDKSSASLHSSLGLAYLKTGEIDKARSALLKARTLDDTDAQAHMGLGYIANREKREDLAIENFLKALNHDGGNLYTVGALKKIYAQRGKALIFHAFSTPEIPGAFKIFPDDPNVLGIAVRASGGRLELVGQQAGNINRDTSAHIETDTDRFLRLDADVAVPSAGNTLAGIYVFRTKRSFIRVGRDQDGRVHVTVRESDLPVEKDVGVAWPDSGPVRLSIELAERMSDRIKGFLSVYVDNRLVGNFKAPSMVRRGVLQAGVWVTAPVDTNVRVHVDNLSLTSKLDQPPPTAP